MTRKIKTKEVQTVTLIEVQVIECDFCKTQIENKALSFGFAEDYFEKGWYVLSHKNISDFANHFCTKKCLINYVEILNA